MMAGKLWESWSKV